LIYGSDRDGVRNAYWQAADGTGAVHRLTEGRYAQNPTAISRDGRFLVLHEITPTSSDDVLQMDTIGTGLSTRSPAEANQDIASPNRVKPLLQSAFSERNATLSPDGAWLAYEADDSGAFEVYVRPPQVDGGRWQVSTSGGTRPVWARSGTELFYASSAGALMRVRVEPGSSWLASTPTTVVKEGYLTAPGGNYGRMYDVSPDGQRFLVVKEGDRAGEGAPSATIVVVQNWLEELKRLVPAN
jgi:Tol biopolymer transport system component